MIQELRRIIHLRSRIRRRINKVRQYLHDRQLPKDGWYETSINDVAWRLNMNHYIDRSIARFGVFEPETTERIKALVTSDMQIIDVGANIGYFTVIFAEQVGDQGRVWSFEPVIGYREQLQWHINQNSLSDRVKVQPYGLSNQQYEHDILLFEASASFYRGFFKDDADHETVRLERLDDVADQLGLERLDFVKVDIDGHECAFLEGARQTLKKHMPMMVIEVAHLFLEEAGCSASGLKHMLEEIGYTLFSEKTGYPFKDLTDFLLDCSFYNHSINVWCIPTELVTDKDISSLNDLPIVSGHRVKENGSHG
jgi:FkbM family methyltransferase